MTDLIERLRALARCEHSDVSVAEEAADALEAAREDAERYRWLSAMATQQADYLGPIFRIDVRRSEPHLFNFDAAVDQARGKGGAVIDRRIER